MAARQASATPATAQLPPQLLALVLQHVNTAERLRCCAVVSTSWHSAAIAATNSVTARSNRGYGLSQEQCTALSSWLRAHAGTGVLVDSITAHGRSLHVSQLQLPVQQLGTLRKLVLKQITVTLRGSPSGSQHSDKDSNSVELPPELSALTCLKLNNCPIQLNALPLFTQLQKLCLLSGYGRNDVSNSTLASLVSLAAALPGMQQLTHLQLHGSYASDAAVSALRHLPRLEVLQLDECKCKAASFAALPASLTTLELRADRDDMIPVSQRLRVSPGSTPGLTQLTTLQTLWVEKVHSFTAQLLGSMPALQTIVVMDCSLAGGGAGLSALQALACLQHLDLHSAEVEGQGNMTAADVAALTASNQLTYLDLGRVLAAGDYKHMFPEGCVRPQLRALTATMQLLSDHEAVRALVRCCRQLEDIDLSDDTLDRNPDGETFEAWDGGVMHNVALFSRLPGLTSLELTMADREAGEVFWRSIGGLTTLKYLHICSLDYAHLGGIVALSGCRQLTYLCAEDWEYWPRFELKTKAGQAPDIWQRLPREALQAALQHYDNAPERDHDQTAALHSLAKAAAEHSLQVERELRQEVSDLQATVAAMGAQLQALVAQKMA